MRRPFGTHVRFVSLAAIALLMPTGSSAAVRKPPLLGIAQETTLALEAAPPSLRPLAGVWIMTAAGYREHRKSQNGYTCIVNRDDPDAIKPTCYDEEGTATILPAVVWFGNQLVAGRAVADVRKDLAASFAKGVFKSPRRAGIAFMLSPHIVNVITHADGRREFGTAPPHYMIYAPNMTNTDLRLSDTDYDANPWLPYIAYAGPHGFLIIPLESK